MRPRAGPWAGDKPRDCSRGNVEASTADKSGSRQKLQCMHGEGFRVEGSGFRLSAIGQTVAAGWGGDFWIFGTPSQTRFPVPQITSLSLRSLSARLENQAVLCAACSKNGRIRVFAGSSKNHPGSRTQRGREATNRDVDFDPFCFLYAGSEDRREDGLSQQACLTTCVFSGRGQEDRFFRGGWGHFSLNKEMVGCRSAER